MEVNNETNSVEDAKIDEALNKDSLEEETIDESLVTTTIQETLNIKEQAENVTAAAEDGSLTDVMLNDFKQNAQAYLSLLNVSPRIAAGLQNDITVIAGLLNLKTDIKNAAVTVAEMASKAIANIIKFFADIYTKIATKTDDLKLKLKKIDNFLSKQDNEIDVSFSVFRSIFREYQIIALANKWDVKAPQISMVFAELIDLVDTMKYSKIPEVNVNGKTLINVSQYVNTDRTTLESELVDYFIGTDDKAKDLGISRDRVKVVRIASDRVDYVYFSEDGREAELTYTRPGKDARVRIAPFETILKKDVTALVESLRNGILALEGPLKKQTNIRINDLKDASNKLVAELNKATSDTKSEGEETKWDSLSKDIKSIWTIYPIIGNKSLYNLYTIINKLLNWLVGLTRLESAV